ncbi:MAG: hypothetical protein M1820_008102 [Bogoriella megaspora]|nr:MAG: hypothetical protein M1820_008102 [Bogoriella megaspora]
MENTDESSIRPVSSLRSKFESLLNQGTPQPSRTASPSLEEPKPRGTGQSLDLPRSAYNDGLVAPRTPVARRSPAFAKPRPSSMGPQSPPLVTVESPHSPEQSPSILRPHSTATVRPVSFHPTSPGIPTVQSPRGPSPRRSPPRSKLQSQDANDSTKEPANVSPFSPPLPSPGSTQDPNKTIILSPEQPTAPTPQPSPGPPPVNRAGKPKIHTKPNIAPSPANGTSLAPDVATHSPDERISPFSTPPSSAETSPQATPPQETPPPINESTKPRIGVVPKLTSSFAPPPTHHVVARKRQESIDAARQPVGRAPTFPPPKGPTAYSQEVERIRSGDLPEDRPGLPPRRDTSALSSMRSASQLREGAVRSSIDAGCRAVSHAHAPSAKIEPPPRRAQSTLSRSPVRNGISPSPAKLVTEKIRKSTKQAEGQSIADDSEDYQTPVEQSAPSLNDFPDSSQANRRPPWFRYRPWDIPTKYETKTLAVCGEFICTTGYYTRVWNARTGQELMTFNHGETVKVTAVAFKPAPNHEDEGKRLWIGTNTGELQELDVPSESIVQTKSSAHSRREIVKIYRYASEMWSLDEDGNLRVWPPDEEGSPSLVYSHHSFQVPKGHTFSMTIGSRLWLATGKEIRVFQPSADPSVEFRLLQKPLVQASVGDVTSGATIGSQPDRIYFGHTDGKVTIYSTRDYSLLNTISVSLYKINALVGVGDYLWAGYKTGMIYVYDTTVQPWKVMKDWHGHDNPVASINMDPTSIWKLDRLQVVSLGTDNMLRLWDGMLKDDWLEGQMQVHDAEYCDFREITTRILTWNAGAVKPSALRHDAHDDNFFREYVQAHEPPDIFVFGFQELVDLEDKKVTAKSFFRSKKKDPSEQEHMSHQYRAWRDYLTRCLQEHMPPSESYDLLHTASMVGLFTAVFVRSSQRTHIQDIKSAEVKRGMGGLHGNKGALILRFILDDSSVCFVNCHLAAGQSQTVHRNNDIAEILETLALPSSPDETRCSDLFVGGGDGSMILDHEICILNGDLNYRIDSMPRDTVVRAVKENNLAKLLDRDQLLLSRKRNPGFRLRAFNENTISFPPTYKYDVGTDNYDSSDKKRSPAWCDRLLYRGVGRIKQTEYRRHEVRVSDHRPVSGLFKFRAKTISQQRQVVVREGLEAEFEAVKERVAHEAK